MAAAKIPTDARLYVGDFSTNLLEHLDSVDFDYTNQALEAQCLDDETVIMSPGRHQISMALSGKWEPNASGGVDEEIFAQIDALNKAMVSYHEGASIGSVAYFALMTLSGYSAGGSHGELGRFSLAGVGAGGMNWARGVKLNDAVRTSTSNGTGHQLGAVGSGEKLVAGIHFTGRSGTSPTFDVEIESDTVGFASPTTRITFDQETDVTSGSQIKTASGPITDDYYRAAYTLGGTSPSSRIVVSLAILKEN